MKMNNDMLSQLELTFKEYDDDLSKELNSFVKDFALGLGDTTQTLSVNRLLIDTDADHFMRIKELISNELLAYEIEMKRTYKDESIDGLIYHVYDDLSGSAVYVSDNEVVEIGSFDMHTGDYKIGGKNNYLVGENHEDRFEYFKSECRKTINNRNRREALCSLDFSTNKYDLPFIKGNELLNHEILFQAEDYDALQSGDFRELRLSGAIDGHITILCSGTEEPYDGKYMIFDPSKKEEVLSMKEILERYIDKSDVLSVWDISVLGKELISDNDIVERKASINR